MIQPQLSHPQARLLQHLAAGSALKSHRYLDGRKVYELHPLEGSARTVRRATVETLRQQGLIDSNKKFPSATFLLTEKGQALITALGSSTSSSG